ncbi:MAG: FkbM family methyltransferase, partial [Bdellovibrionaceae bacterium]|nr:FkbM family methyltransferase [Pseudobdellovibrionaceae bacterium]
TNLLNVNALKSFISSKLLNFRILQKFRHSKVSYSQLGEDLIVTWLFNALEISIPKVVYLDIGAYHPYSISNTALLYSFGASGYLVEPNPITSLNLKACRSRDRVLNIGVTSTDSNVSNFFEIDPPALSTFSEEEAKRLQSLGHKIVSTHQVSVMNINDLLEELPPIDFLNLDIEGIDFDVLSSLNFTKYRPKVFCVETVMYSPNLIIDKRRKRKEVIKLMEENGYVLFADTWVNSIFVDSNFASGDNNA